MARRLYSLPYINYGIMPIWHGPYRVDSLHSVPGVPKRIVVFNTFNAIAI